MTNAKHLPAKEVLGLDIGRVITSDATDGESDIFSDDYLSSLPRPGAITTIRDLVYMRFGDDVHLISKCQERIELRTRELFAKWRFFERTGVLEGNMHFCRKPEDKVRIAKSLGVTTVVDDRGGILNRMPESMERILFVPANEQVPLLVPEGIIPVIGWAGTRDVLLQTTSIY